MIKTLRPRQAAQTLGIALSTFWLKAKTDPDFPRLIRLSANATVVRESDLHTYIEKKAALPYAARPTPGRKKRKILSDAPGDLQQNG